MTAVAAQSPGYLLEQGEECSNTSGVHLRFRRSLADFCPSAAHSAELVAGRPAPLSAHPELVSLAEHFPRGALFSIWKLADSPAPASFWPASSGRAMRAW